MPIKLKWINKSQYNLTIEYYNDSENEHFPAVFNTVDESQEDAFTHKTLQKPSFYKMINNF